MTHDASIFVKIDPGVLDKIRKQVNDLKATWPKDESAPESEIKIPPYPYKFAQGWPSAASLTDDPVIMEKLRKAIGARTEQVIREAIFGAPNPLTVIIERRDKDGAWRPISDK